MFISRERSMAELAHMALIDPVEMFDLPDLIGRHLLVEYCGRDDMAHVLVGAEKRDPHDFEPEQVEES